jgi:hypothetical protein
MLGDVCFQDRQQVRRDPHHGFRRHSSVCDHELAADVYDGPANPDSAILQVDVGAA